MSARVAFVFPGQGSQAVGMGADIAARSPAARAIYAAADDALGFALSDLCFHGPEEALRETINTQPAIVTTSLAMLAALQEAAAEQAGRATMARDTRQLPPLQTPLRAAYVAGHSVGEYAALAAAGALEVAATVRLVRERGRLMHLAGLRCPSGMAAVLGLDAATLEAICAEATSQAQQAQGDSRSVADDEGEDAGAGRVVVANDNAPGQIVISGAQAALERAMALAKSAGARRVVPLAVSGAFHSPVMAPAAAGLARAVDAAPIGDARIPIIANISAHPISTIADLRAELARQIESPVQWTRTVEYLAGAGVELFVEIGVGQVLTGLVKRIAKGAAFLAVGTADELVPAARQLRTLVGVD